MQAEANTFLKIIDFTQLVNWSSYALLGKELIYTQKYPFVRIGDFLKRNKEAVKIKDEISYKRATIRINGNGISLRDTVLGKEIGTKNQFIIHAGQFLLSKIDARNGAFGVVPTELEGGIITGNFWTFDVDYLKINPHYLSLLTGTKEFQKLSQSASVGTTNRNYLQESQFLNFEIPLPSLIEQEKILDAYSSKIEEAKSLQKRAVDFDKEIEKYFFEVLDIIETKKRNFSKTLNLVPFYSIDKWGVEYILGSNSDNLLKSRKYQNIRLGHIVEINPTTKLPKGDMDISFIPMECISDEYGEVIKLRKKKVSESKGYTKFQEGDLIWARITPCMQNGKSAIVTDLENRLGCGSTEFHVIRNSNKDIDLKYIYFILRLEPVLQNAMSHFTGSAGQQRVPKSFLENLEIPVPPLIKQKDIVAHLTSIKEQKKLYNARANELMSKAESDFEIAIFK